MKAIRRKAKLASVFLTILMLYITVPFDSILAAMIGTEATLDSPSAQRARDEINKLLLREDVQYALLAHGIGPMEAKARIDSLSDAEVVRLADQIKNLPGGGNLGKALYGVPKFVLGAAIILAVVGIFVLIVFGIYKAVTYEKSDSAEEYPKSVGGSEYNPEEPWTGVWDVGGSRGYTGRWVLKQKGNTVLSTKESFHKIVGDVSGNELQGKIPDDQYSARFQLKISSDGKSFTGIGTDYLGRSNMYMKGKRIE